MTTTIESVQRWLLDNAAVLRKGGAPATADTWEEISELLDKEQAQIIRNRDSILNYAREQACGAIGEGKVERLESAGLTVVPVGRVAA